MFPSIPGAKHSPAIMKIIHTLSLKSVHEPNCSFSAKTLPHDNNLSLQKIPLLFTVTQGYLSFYPSISSHRVNSGWECTWRQGCEGRLICVVRVWCLGSCVFSCCVSHTHIHTHLVLPALWSNLCLSPSSWSVINGSLFSCIMIPGDLLTPEESLTVQLNLQTAAR